MITGPGVITTPASGVLTRLHTHKPAITSDTIKTASLWFGDPNIQLWSAPYGFVSDWSIAADASGTDGATMSVSGMSQFWAEDTATLPAQTIGSLLMPGAMQVWLDTASAIGTTEIIGRVVSAEISGASNVAAKYLAAGLVGGLTYSKIGRGKPEVSGTITMEVPDSTQIDLFNADTSVKMRTRINGDLIETVAGPLSYYNFIEWDIFGKLKFDSWADLEGTNRTVVFRVDTIYDATLGADYALRAQNSSATV